MSDPLLDWWMGLPAAVTVTDTQGVILAMNARALETFGGTSLVGQLVQDCHPEPARSRLLGLLATGAENHYTIEKKGRRKIIHQLPWYRDGAFAGLVEISIPIPSEMPHHVRAG